MVNFFTDSEFLVSMFKHLILVAVISFFSLQYIIKKNYFEYLNVFGSIIFILWLFVFLTFFLTYYAINYHWVSKSIYLFNFLLLNLPGGFNILPYLIVFFLIIIVVLFFIINISRIVKILFNYIKSKIELSYRDIVVKMIFNDENLDSNKSDEWEFFFKKIKRFRFTRTIFIDELLRMHEILSGQIKERINFILGRIYVKSDSLFYLNDSDWHLKIKGLRHLAEMDEKEQINNILKLTNSKNHVLRSEAQLALARLIDTPNPLSYFEDMKNPITLWEQINLFHFFKENKKPVGEMFSLLTSTNPSVITFGLRCTTIFNSYDNYHQITEFVNHPDVKIRDTAIYSLSFQNNPKTAELIMKYYKKEFPLSTRLVMIRTLGTIGDSNVILFLENLLQMETNYDIILSTFKSISLIKPEVLDSIKFSNNLLHIKILNHVNDPRI